MVLGGLVLSLIPGVPPLELPPDVVFLVFLPPLLFAAGYFTSLRDFKADLRPIVLLASGLVLAVAAGWFLARVLEPAIAVTITLLAPYAAYLLAEYLGVSGILATVVAGLYGRSAMRHTSSDTRVVATGAWQMVIFLLNGLVFVLIGLQLPNVLGG